MNTLYTQNITPTKSDRNASWLTLHNSGKSYNDIAFEHARTTGERVSPQRVATVVKKLRNKEATS